MTNITGTAGNDRLVGTSLADLIDGLGGNDTIYGRSGDDLIYGRAGNDTIYGEAGIDRVSGGDGNDTIDGGVGPDRLWGDGGDDLIYGGDQDDKLYGGDGNDRILGGNGNDFIDGGEGRNSLFGGDGNDVIQLRYELTEDEVYDRHSDAGPNTIFAGAGNDMVTGSTGNDNIRGEAGNDTIRAGVGDDRLDGGDGNDYLDGGWGNDILIGGAGNDVLEGAGAAFNASGESTKIFTGSGQDVVRYDFSTTDGAEADIGAHREQANSVIADFTHGQDKLSLSFSDGTLGAEPPPQIPPTTFAALDTNHNGILTDADAGISIGQFMFGGKEALSMTIDVGELTAPGSYVGTGTITLFDVTTLVASDYTPG